MTQDEIISMAREAGFGHSNFHNGFQLLAPSTICTNLLTRFAALVAAHEREKQAKLMILNGKSVVEQVHSYVSRNDTDFTSESMAKMVCDFIAAEREACAKVCDDIGDSDNGYGCAAAIRARSEK